MGILIQLGKGAKPLPRHKGPLIQAKTNEKLGMLPSTSRLADAEPPHPQGGIDGLLLSLLAALVTLLMVVMRMVVVVVGVGVVHVLGAGAAPS